MAENTKIEWATHSFSPWLGCSEVSIGCARCYAKAMAGRLGVKWGPNGTRRRTAESTWKQVERWNRAEEPFVSWSNHERPRVFPSLCDPFEQWDGVVQHPRGGRCLVTRSWLMVSSNTNPEYGVNATLDDVRRDFFALIDRCPNLDFLLLTKRPENIRRMWPLLWGGFADGSKTRGHDRHNVWLLLSASDQQSLEAGLPHLLACRDLVPVLGLSLEPLVGPVDLGFENSSVKFIDWVIVGGESGPRHRPMDLAWLKSIADQCSAAGVPLFIKQDARRKPGQQGRIPNHLWDIKELPNTQRTRT